METFTGDHELPKGASVSFFLSCEPLRPPDNQNFLIQAAYIEMPIIYGFYVLDDTYLQVFYNEAN